MEDFFGHILIRGGFVNRKNCYIYEKNDAIQVNLSSP